MLANHATLALGLADARMRQQRMHLLEQRDRIAAELHDQVLGRLYAIGMSFQATARDNTVVDPSRITELVDSTDDTITCIRTVIRDLHRLAPLPPPH
ncbi:histidine kinase [Sporichthya brevicatena]|uniref:histidine kinase n=1 Tax=Sporichthya brevicatena TaxID=171442 RepID=UPI0031DE4E93